MKRVLAAATAINLALAAGVAGAQVDPLAAHEQAVTRMELDAARRAQMAEARRAQAARDHAAAAQTLRSLQAQGASTGRPYRPSPPEVLPERGDPSAALSLRLDALDRLTDARLARSNEVLRAIKPASER